MQISQVIDLEHSSGAKYAAEFVGTTFLVFTIGCNVHVGSLGAALSIGAMLSAMVFALGSVSGAHFNPAVTLSVLICGRGKIEPRDAAAYVAAQILGGLLGSMMYLAIIGKAFTLQPVGLYTVSQVFVLEILFTAALCYVVLNVATTESRMGITPNAFFGLAIGFTVVAAAIAIGPITGCSLNPAVSIGAIMASSLAHGPSAARFWEAYVFGPFFGAFVGAMGFYAVRGGLTGMFEFTRLDSERKPHGFDIEERETPARAPPPAPVRAPAPAPEPAVKARSVDLPSLSRRGSISLKRKDSVYFGEELSNSELFCGLSWKVKQLGLLQEPVDLDVSVVKFNKKGKCQGVVYFADKDDTANGIRHGGDEVSGATGSGGEDSERINFRTSTIRPSVDVLVFVATIFSAGVTSFDAVEDFSVRVGEVGPDGQAKELCKYNKADVGSGNALVVAMVYRRGERWAFKPIDEAVNIQEHATARSLAERGSLGKYVKEAEAEHAEVLRREKAEVGV